MVEAAVITLFFLITIGLGCLFTFFHEEKNFESIVLRLGIGLGAIPVLGVILHTFSVPLDWKIFLIISLIPLFLFLLKKGKKRSPNNFITKRGIILLIIFLACVILYCNGPFTYPWLENDDPWSHAAGVKYVALERNINIPSGIFHYINPYPPGYDLFFGIFHQIHPSLYWTLKFFNGLIIAFGILFFYFFVKELTGDKTKSLIATFVLAIIPCYLSHFIWAHALVVTLFFPAFTTLLKAQKDKRFIIPCSIVIAGIFLTQPTQSIKFCILFFILAAAFLIIRKKLPHTLWAPMMIAGLIALLWWGPVIKGMIDGSSHLAVRVGTDVSQHTTKTSGELNWMFNPKGGTATREYHLNDYLYPPPQNMINNPTGVGVSLCLLALFGIPFLIYRIATGTEEGKIYGLTTMGWLIFTFLGMNSATFNLPVGLFAFRFWMLFAIPVSLLVAEFVAQFIQNTGRPAVKYLALALIVLTACVQSGYRRIQINTAIWPWGSYWKSTGELNGYIWLRNNLPPDTKVFAFTDNVFVIGNDMRADFWREEYRKDFDNAVNLDIIELYSRLKKNGFTYLIVGRREVDRFGRDAVNAKLGEIKNCGLFQPILQDSATTRLYKLL